MAGRRRIARRRATPALSVGACVEVAAQGDLLTYVREDGAQRLLVALNLGGAPQAVELGGRRSRVVLATQRAREGQAVAGALELGGEEGLVLELAD